MKTENYFSKHSAVVQLIGEAELHHQNSLLFWQKILELEKTIASDFDYFPEGMVNGLIESVGCSSAYYDMAIARLIQIRDKFQRSKKQNTGETKSVDEFGDEFGDDSTESQLDSPVDNRKIFYIDVGDMPLVKMTDQLDAIKELIQQAKKIKHD